MNKLVFIEFLGIPGAGKTAVAREVLANLRADQYTVITLQEITEASKQLNRLQRYVYIASGILTTRNDFMAALRFVILFFTVGLQPRFERRYYWWIVKLFFLKSAFLRKRNGEVFIFEGEMHFLPLINIKQKNRKSIERLLRTIFSADSTRIFISVKTPIEVAMTRAHKDYFDLNIRLILFAMDPKKRREEYARIEENRKYLVDMLRTNERVARLLEVDGTNPPKESADYVTKIITKEFL